jgi:hypothetical protein
MYVCLYVCIFVCVYVKCVRVRTIDDAVATIVHPWGIMFPFWALRVHSPFTAPFKMPHFMHTVESASAF